MPPKRPTTKSQSTSETSLPYEDRNYCNLMTFIRTVIPDTEDDYENRRDVLGKHFIQMSHPQLLQQDRPDYRTDTTLFTFRELVEKYISLYKPEWEKHFPPDGVSHFTQNVYHAILCGIFTGKDLVQIIRLLETFTKILSEARQGTQFHDYYSAAVLPRPRELKKIKLIQKNHNCSGVTSPLIRFLSTFNDKFQTPVQILPRNLETFVREVLRPIKNMSVNTIWNLQTIGNVIDGLDYIITSLQSRDSQQRHEELNRRILILLQKIQKWLRRNIFHNVGTTGDWSSLRYYLPMLMKRLYQICRENGDIPQPIPECEAFFGAIDDVPLENIVKGLQGSVLPEKTPRRSSGSGQVRLSGSGRASQQHQQDLRARRQRWDEQFQDILRRLGEPPSASSVPQRTTPLQTKRSSIPKFAGGGASSQQRQRPQAPMTSASSIQTEQTKSTAATPRQRRQSLDIAIAGLTLRQQSSVKEKLVQVAQQTLIDFSKSAPFQHVRRGLLPQQQQFALRKRKQSNAPLFYSEQLRKVLLELVVYIIDGRFDLVVLVDYQNMAHNFLSKPSTFETRDSLIKNPSFLAYLTEIVQRTRLCPPRKILWIMITQGDLAGPERDQLFETEMIDENTIIVKVACRDWERSEEPFDCYRIPPSMNPLDDLFLLVIEEFLHRIKKAHNRALGEKKTTEIESAKRYIDNLRLDDNDDEEYFEKYIIATHRLNQAIGSKEMKSTFPDVLRLTKDKLRDNKRTRPMTRQSGF